MCNNISNYVVLLCRFIVKVVAMHFLGALTFDKVGGPEEVEVCSVSCQWPVLCNSQVQECLQSITEPLTSRFCARNILQTHARSYDNQR